MIDLRETLRRLARRFVARDLMVSSEELVCAEDEQEAGQKLEAHPKFDVIPIRQADKLVAFLERGQSKRRTIQVQHVIGSETPIIDLIDSLCERPFVFVVGRHEVIGFVHFSDLNDPIVKLPYFVLLESVERHVADLVRTTVEEQTLPQFIKDPDRRSKIREKMIKLSANEADRDWVTLLYFREILEAACHFGKLSLKVSEIEDLSAVRTRVAHAATEELVETRSDAQRLRNVGRLCSSILFSDRAA